jgi:hypothetical protein
MRSHPLRYLTATGHEVVGALVIKQNDRIAFVEKLYANAR